MTPGAADLLLVIDVQVDFLPGGALPVRDGHAVVAPINALQHRFRHVVLMQDWHPADHGSFVEQGGPWPVHCVAGSPGAQLHAALDADRVEVVVDKGMDPALPGYSGFERTDLEALLRERGVDELTVVGLATDYCVKNTALDALGKGFAVTVDPAAVRPVDVAPGDGDRALEQGRHARSCLAASAHRPTPDARSGSGRHARSCLAGHRPQPPLTGRPRGCGGPATGTPGRPGRRS